MSYTLDTRRARSEVRGQRAQSRLLSELVATASNDQNRDQQIGRTLFNLVIPIELEAYLAGSGEMQIELDPQTAKIPWELLDTKSDSDTELPWAIRVKLLRKLRIREFRDHVTDAEADASVLVIGEPECPKEYPRLYGARTEAIAVRDCLKGDGGLEEAMMTALISDEPTQVGVERRTVVNALFEKLANRPHRRACAGAGGNRAVCALNRTFLGPDGSAACGRFQNCVRELLSPGGACRRVAQDELRSCRVASGVAGALIEIGMRCVIAAG